MKYISVEVLKDTPDHKAGEIIPRMPRETGWFNYSESIAKMTEYFEARPEWFRLIPEPEFKVGGYAKRKYNGDKGEAYRIKDIDWEGGYLFLEGPFGKSLFMHYTPLSEEEYLKQEEGKKPKLPCPYEGELNTKRIAQYRKVANQFILSESSIRDIFCAGVDWYKEQLERIYSTLPEEVK